MICIYSDGCLYMFEQNIVFLYKPRTQDMATEMHVGHIHVLGLTFGKRVGHAGWATGACKAG